MIRLFLDCESFSVTLPEPKPHKDSAILGYTLMFLNSNSIVTVVLNSLAL